MFVISGGALKMKVLAFSELRGKGIPFSRQWIHKLVRRGEFPTPLKIGSKTNAWAESEINEYLENRLAQRGSEMKTASSA
jgi:prophage regulatory protein